MSERKLLAGAWDDDDNAYRPLTRQQAEAFRDRHPQVSPWRVVAVQVTVGAVLVSLAWLLFDDGAVWVSALYGAAVVAVPGALMARGATSANARLSPMLGAFTFLSWAMVKIGFSVAMLLLAPRIVQSLSWPALLVAMVLCMQTYWLALLWRKPQRPQQDRTRTTYGSS
jgi:ATP synthase protein I